MAVNLSPIWGAGAQLLDNSGNVLSGGKIYTYAAGTTTQVATFTSNSGLTANSNPIILNSAGRVPYEIWLTDGQNYKFVLKDSNDVLIGTWDNLSGINSNFIAYTNEQEIQTATAGQTVFTLTTMQYLVGTDSLSVFVDGVNQYGPGAQYAYTETNSNTVTFASGLHVGAEVKFTSTQVQNAGVADASQISYTYPATKAVTENVEERLAQYVSVKDFGATGDGVTDDTAAFQNAVAACAGKQSVYVPYGDYIITDTINITNVHIFGDGISRLDSSANVTLSGTFDKPAFYTNGRCTIEGFSITGNATTGTGSQSLIKIDTTNEATVRSMFLNGGFNLITITGLCFYLTIDNCRFYNCKGSWISGITTAPQGIDLFVSNCRGTSSDTDQDYGFYFEGLGSIIMSDCQFAPCTASVALFHVSTMASLAGVQMFSNTVFENQSATGYGVYLRTDPTHPSKFFQFSNCYIAGGPSATRIDYGVSNVFTNTYFTGGNFAFIAYEDVQHQVFEGCQFQTTDTPIRADSGITTISASFTDCVYTGGFPMVYLPYLASSQIGYIYVRGGYAGSNADPISLPSKNTIQDISLIGQNYGPIQYSIFTGTLSGSGTASITHGIYGGNSRILSVTAFWKGGSGEAYPLPVVSVDGTSVNLGGGGASSYSQNYRCYVQFVQENVAW